MVRTRRLRILQLILFAGFSLPAQQTWIVDAAGGSGSHFSDLPPAVAAAAPGDIVLVRYSTASYSSVTLRRGITIVGEERGSTYPRYPRLQSIILEGLPSSETIVLARFTFSSMTMRNTAGRVVIDGNEGGVPMLIEDCADVVIRNLSNSAGYLYATTIRRSRVTFEGCDLEAAGGGMFAAQFPTITAEDSVLLVHTSEIEGGIEYFNIFCTRSGRATPALSLIRSTAFLGRGTLLTGGGWVNNCPGNTAPFSCYYSVLGGSGTILADPGATFGCPVDPSVRLWRTRIWMVTNGSAVRGSSMDVRLEAPSGTFALLVASFAPPRRLPSPLGEIGIDPTAFVVLTARSVGISGELRHPMPVETGLHFGTVFATQAGLILPSGQPVVTLPAFAPVLP